MSAHSPSHSKVTLESIEIAAPGRDADACRSTPVSEAVELSIRLGEDRRRAIARAEAVRASRVPMSGQLNRTELARVEIAKRRISSGHYDQDEVIDSAIEAMIDRMNVRGPGGDRCC